MLITTRLLLNNWHYINEKILAFNEDINFFTGHSGSGKSTVIDALQVLLYADTDGRGFFNKAAKDDSNRTLIEYLRGMNNVGENGDASYLRNKNFSSTIALEFFNTETKEYQTVGVSFDVDVSANNVERMFFWHKGPLLENSYRYEAKTMSLSQLKEYLSRSRTSEEWWISRTNEKFRSKLYETYLGGLDERKFPMLFKKAISFRMDTKLEDFVKEFICVEKDIHIEDMQESVVQYVRLKRKLDDTKNEIRHLEEIRGQYETYHEVEETIAQLQYSLNQIELDIVNSKLATNQDRQKQYEQDRLEIEKQVKHLEKELHNLQTKQVEVRTAIKNSGYDHLVQEKADKTELLRRMEKSKAQYDKVSTSLIQWKASTEFLSDDVCQLIDQFTAYQATEESIKALQVAFADIRMELENKVGDLTLKSSTLENEIKEANASIAQLNSGTKVYPKYLLEAKEYLSSELQKRLGRTVSVEILADLIDVKNEDWLNAVEGFMSNHKLTLIVPPEAVKLAMELYQEMDPKRYYKVSVVDTEKVFTAAKAPLSNALSEEISTDLPYVQKYIEFLMGTVIKCESLEELREQKSGITKECVLYHGFRIQHIDPKHYEQFAYIGQSSIERRLAVLEESVLKLMENKTPIDAMISSYKKMLSYEYVKEASEYYLEMKKDILDIRSLTNDLEEISGRIEELKTRDLAKWKEEEERLFVEANECSTHLSQTKANLITKETELSRLKSEFLELTTSLQELQANFVYELTRDEQYRKMREAKGNVRLEKLRDQVSHSIQSNQVLLQKEYDMLVEVRDVYRTKYVYRGFVTTVRDNVSYDSLLEKLQSEKLQEFTSKAAEQAKKATSHFKTDFVYKIRDAIKEAMEQKDDLNQILKKTDFGKEKYRFVIEKNKGEDGKFYTMFMDENLEINPNRLSNHMENQMDLFSSSHEDQYSDLINELIDIFMPPEDSSPEQLEEARRNIEKYADYRTYLSFDMEQIIEGMPPMRLSKMLTKNSGGEGQNPLYVALLASFAQVYRITLRKNVRRRLTPRLVILDEAFSKMDGEKVASCVELIRKLGFQAIISATNDKIQNYVESVDKTFVFANPNKSFISIQSFEKKEFGQLLADMEDTTSEVEENQLGVVE